MRLSLASRAVLALGLLAAHVPMAHAAENAGVVIQELNPRFPVDGMMLYGAVLQDKASGAVRLEINLRKIIGKEDDSRPEQPVGATVVGLTIPFRILKLDSNWQMSGTAKLVASPGVAHYSADLTLDGPGTYRVLATIEAPKVNGDPWWLPIDYRGRFKI
jgi:uncharacterized protein involved in high-affinity Fe2+ transport